MHSLPPSYDQQYKFWPNVQPYMYELKPLPKQCLHCGKEVK